MVYINYHLCYGGDKLKEYIAKRTFTIPYRTEDDQLLYHVINQGEKYAGLTEENEKIILYNNKSKYIEIEKHTLFNCFKLV